MKADILSKDGRKRYRVSKVVLERWAKEYGHGKKVTQIQWDYEVILMGTIRFKFLG